MEFSKTYKISEEEITRRKKAFSSMILFLFLSVSLAVKLILGLQYSQLCILMAALGTLLLISRLLMEKAFESFSEIRLRLTENYLERRTSKENEKIYYKDIDKVSFKNTVHENIREIKINTKEKQFYFNGIAEMKDFSKDLNNFMGKDVKIIHRREWIDFDSKYFYPIFGVVIGSGAVFLFNVIINSYGQSTRLLFAAFMVFVMGLGGYFFYAQPISKSHGLRFRVIDRVMGIIFVLLGLGLFYFYLK